MLPSPATSCMSVAAVELWAKLPQPLSRTATTTLNTCAPHEGFGIFSSINSHETLFCTLLVNFSLYKLLGELFFKDTASWHLTAVNLLPLKSLWNYNLAILFSLLYIVNRETKEEPLPSQYLHTGWYWCPLALMEWVWLLSHAPRSQRHTGGLKQGEEKY